MDFIAHGIASERRYVPVGTNDASDTTATGEAMRLLRVKDFGATCDVSVSRHGSRFGCIIEYHWHRDRRHLPAVVLLTIDAHIILYPLFRGTAHTSISTDVALLWDSRDGVFVVSEKVPCRRKCVVEKARSASIPHVTPTQSHGRVARVVRSDTELC